MSFSFWMAVYNAVETAGRGDACVARAPHDAGIRSGDGYHPQIRSALMLPPGCARAATRPQSLAAVAALTLPSQSVFSGLVRNERYTKLLLFIGCIFKQKFLSRVSIEYPRLR